MKRIGLFFLLITILFSTRAGAYVDKEEEDIIVDAPWRTIRDYVPVLLFTPEFKPSRRVRLVSFELQNFDIGARRSSGTIFLDSREGEDNLVCAGAVQTASLSSDRTEKHGMT